jgi:ribonuclease HI
MAFQCGEGTNTKEKLLGIWETLTLATHLSLLKLQALGDSKVIIEWINNRGRFQASAIEGWKHKTKELIKKNQEISFQHIFRDFNKEADQLSKQAIHEPKGRITYFKWEPGIAGPMNHLVLF